MLLTLFYAKEPEKLYPQDPPAILFYIGFHKSIIHIY